jgi:hypothetical protein
MKVLAPAAFVGNHLFYLSMMPLFSKNDLKSLDALGLVLFYSPPPFELKATISAAAISCNKPHIYWFRSQ